MYAAHVVPGGALPKRGAGIGARVPGTKVGGLDDCYIVWIIASQDLYWCKALPRQCLGTMLRHPSAGGSGAVTVGGKEGLSPAGPADKLVEYAIHNAGHILENLPSIDEHLVKLCAVGDIEVAASAAVPVGIHSPLKIATTNGGTARLLQFYSTALPH